VPYPNVKDIEIELKRKYNNGKPQLIKGDAWYTQQAFRAVNQAIGDPPPPLFAASRALNLKGRCIRHVKDYGAVLFLDDRFAPPSALANLSKWVRAVSRVYPTFDDALASLRQFYADAPRLGGGEEGGGDVAELREVEGGGFEGKTGEAGKEAEAKRSEALALEAAAASVQAATLSVNSLLTSKFKVELSPLDEAKRVDHTPPPFFDAGVHLRAFVAAAAAADVVSTPPPRSQEPLSLRTPASNDEAMGGVLSNGHVSFRDGRPPLKAVALRELGVWDERGGVVRAPLGCGCGGGHELGEVVVAADLAHVASIGVCAVRASARCDAEAGAPAAAAVGRLGGERAAKEEGSSDEDFVEVALKRKRRSNSFRASQ
jgi:hypothetical protein